MKIERLPKEFQEAQKIIQEINEKGYEAYYVGGSVRDILLGKSIHDVDIATSAYPEEIKQLFKRTVDIGIDHGTVLVLFGEEQYEITTFRTESTYQDFRRPDHVTFVRSLKEDLQRRDFTINAFAMDISGTIIDLFDGISDIEKQLIRAVGDAGERFHEDALRMLRGLRFASQLDFMIEEQTLSAIEKWHPLLEKISVERIAIEFTKLLMGENRIAGMKPFLETGTYQYCPGLKEHKAALQKFAELPAVPFGTEEQAWALLLYTLKIKPEDVTPFLKKWKLSNKFIQEVTKIVDGLNIRLTGEWEATDIYKLGLKSARHVEELLVYFNKEVKAKQVQAMFAELPIKERSELAISGKELMAYLDRPPGKWLGLLIRTLENAVVNQKVKNERLDLIVLAQQSLKSEKAGEV